MILSIGTSTHGALLGSTVASVSPVLTVTIPAVQHLTNCNTWSTLSGISQMHNAVVTVERVASAI